MGRKKKYVTNFISIGERMLFEKNLQKIEAKFAAQQKETAEFDAFAKLNNLGESIT